MAPTQDSSSLPFGSLRPSLFITSLIRLCHQPQGPRLSRIVAPLVRKLVMSQPAKLPLDLNLDGLRLRCYLSDNYSEKKFVFTPWRYDRPERTLLAQQLNRGGTFIDIGANIGLYSLSAASAIGKQPGRIIAVEPNPATLERLRFNLAANPQLQSGLLTIEVLDIGIADTESSFELKLDDHNLGQSSIAHQNRSKHIDAASRSVTIHCQPLLELLKKQQVDQLTALKIDIEGAEDQAMAPYLRNAPDTLLAGMVIIENSPHLWSEDVFALLKQRGYQLKLQTRLNSVFMLPG